MAKVRLLLISRELTSFELSIASQICTNLSAARPCEAAYYRTNPLGPLHPSAARPARGGFKGKSRPLGQPAPGRSFAQLCSAEGFPGQATTRSPHHLVCVFSNNNRRYVGAYPTPCKSRLLLTPYGGERSITAGSMEPCSNLVHEPVAHTSLWCVVSYPRIQLVNYWRASHEFFFTTREINTTGVSDSRLLASQRYLVNYLCLNHFGFFRQDTI